MAFGTALHTHSRPASRMPALSALRVLVVDDQPDAADSLGILLTLQGHSVVCAYDGLTAIEQAAHYQPDVVFLDLELPRMNGFEIARLIRRTPGLRAVRLIAVTGRDDDEARRLTQETGFSAHLLKPLDPDLLDQALNSP